MPLRLSISKSECAVLTNRMTERAWTASEVAMILGTHVLLFFLASFTGLFFYEEQIPAAQLAVTYLIYLAITALIYCINRRRGATWADSFGMGLRQLRYLLFSPLFYLIILPGLILSTQLWHWMLQGAGGSDIELQDAAKTITQETSWLQHLYIFTAILIAPLFEEIMFRGLLLPYLVKKRGLVFGITMLSFFFALIHFHLPSFVPLVLLSALLCLAYWRSGSLWLCIGTHAVFNTVTIFVLRNQG